MDSWNERDSGSNRPEVISIPTWRGYPQRAVDSGPARLEWRGAGPRCKNRVGGTQVSDWLEIPVDQEPYLRAIRLFNDGTFFEAHEVWEDVWRASVPPEKQFLQGLIQVAVALHHHGKGNLAGARSLLARGTRNLTGYPEGFGGIQLVRLLESLEQWRNALAEGKPVPRLPQL
jgi:hypothetical protein